MLSVLIFLPLVVAIFLAWTPRDAAPLHRGIALGATLVELILAITLWASFSPEGDLYQFRETSEGSLFGIRYMLGVDGPALLLILLTTALMPLVVLSTYSAVKDRVREFMIALLVLQSAMIGAFCALDLFVFYVFWEFMLIPMGLLIGVWGGERRIYAAIKFFLYTLGGSLLMLVAILYVHAKTGGNTFAIEDILVRLREGQLSSTEEQILFLAFALSFAIKIPLFPVHTWLPDAHTEAPTAGSVVLAGVLLKMGIYGFYRFAIPMFPQALGELSPLFIVLSVVGIVYGAMVAFAQTDIKRLVAYSSVSHMGLVMLGLLTMNPEGVNGSILQMVNHGISTGALFLLVGILYERRHTRMMYDYGGLAKTVPVLATFFLIVTLSSIGLPGTNGFIGEFLILDGAMQDALVARSLDSNPWSSFAFTSVIIAATGIILGAVYMLTMVRKVFFGPVVHEANKRIKDLCLREWVVMVPLVLSIFVIGLRPGLVLDHIEPGVENFLEQHAAAVHRTRNPGVDPSRFFRRAAAPTEQIRRVGAQAARIAQSEATTSGKFDRDARRRTSVFAHVQRQALNPGGPNAP